MLGYRLNHVSKRGPCPKVYLGETGNFFSSILTTLNASEKYKKKIKTAFIGLLTDALVLNYIVRDNIDLGRIYTAFHE